jgi:anti-sigma regulatory factor (Ser/Thr protein kinase)
MPFEIDADLGQLHRIREYVTEAAVALNVDAGALDDLRLAIDEAVTNVLTHGYGGAGKINIELLADGADIVVKLVDEAPAFDPAFAPHVDLRPPGERDQPGGFGVYLIQSVMDDVRHRPTETGNELTMIKRGAIDG